MEADEVGFAVEIGVPVGDVPFAVAVLVEDPGVGLAVLVGVHAQRDRLGLVVGNVERRIHLAAAVHVDVADERDVVLGAPLIHDLALAGLGGGTYRLRLVGTIRCR